MKYDKQQVISGRLVRQRGFAGAYIPFYSDKMVVYQGKTMGRSVLFSGQLAVISEHVPVYIKLMQKDTWP